MNNYTVIDYPSKNSKFGRYSGSTPMNAAKKAFNKLTSFIDIKNNDMLIFSIKNIRTGKIYKYIGTKIELYKPLIINKGGKNVVYSHKNIITKYFSEIEEI